MKSILKYSILIIMATSIFVLSGCGLYNCYTRVFWEQAYEALTSENGKYEYQTFLVTIIEKREYDGNRCFRFSIDEEYYRQHYRTDEIATGDKRELWELRYSLYTTLEFLLIEDNYNILVENGGLDLLEIGTTLLITTNTYDSVGWRFPVLGIEVDDVVYLEFEPALDNLLNYIQNAINQFS